MSARGLQGTPFFSSVIPRTAQGLVHTGNTNRVRQLNILLRLDLIRVRHIHLHTRHRRLPACIPRHPPSNNSPVRPHRITIVMAIRDHLVPCIVNKGRNVRRQSGLPSFLMTSALLTPWRLSQSGIVGSKGRRLGFQPTSSPGTPSFLSRQRVSSGRRRMTR